MAIASEDYNSEKGDPEIACTHADSQDAADILFDQTDSMTPVESDNDRILELKQLLTLLERKFDEKIAVDEHKAILFDKMYDELASYKKDIYIKIMLPFINETLLLIDDYKRIIAKLDENTPPDKLLRYLSDVPGSLEDILEVNGVEKMREDSEKFNPKTQRSTGAVPTDNPGLNGIIAEHIHPGYWWNGRILKPEVVKVYKFTEK